MISQHHNLIFNAKIDDRGVCPANMGQILARWQCPVPTKVAEDMLNGAMHLALHQRIVMAIKMAHNGGTFVFRCRFFCLTNCT